MRRKLLPLILAGALSVAAVAPTSAATCTINRGGAAGLVAAVALVQANVCDVFILNNSLNNLLRNADIHVLENILNNSPILSFNDVDVDVDVDVEDNFITVTVLGGTVVILGS